nr:transposase domain-containing protein [Sphingomonas sp. TX0522]
MDNFKSWFSAAELADLKLPGVPHQKRKVNERAEAEGWALRTGPLGEPLARPRQARGGGLEYHLDVLPAAARAAIAAAGVEVVADVSPHPETRAASLWRWLEGSSDKVKAEAKRRLRAIAMVEAYERAGMNRSAAVPSAAARLDVGASTLWSWIKLIEGVAPADRLPYLAPRNRGGGANAEVDSGAWQFLLSDYLRLEQPTFTSCYWRMKHEYAEPRGLTVPHEKTLRRKLEREVDGRLVVMRRGGMEALRRSMPAQERSVLELHALEAVNIDGHKFDVFVKWPDGRVGRAMMVAIQDIYSRKFLAWRLDESENALSTRLVFADLFAKYGIPRICVLDNGRAFASKIITGGAKSRFRFKIKDEEPTGVLTALGIETRFALPYRGQSKPIERGFRDLCDTIAKHPSCAGAYTGNRPNAKPENYGSKAIPIETFRALVDVGMAAHNAKVGRRTETAQGRSFDQVFAESYAISPIGKATPEQLRLALLTAEDRTCDRETGVVTLEGNRYWCADLARYKGQKLTLRFDPDDLHGVVHVYERGGAFIATAPAIAKSGFTDKAAAGRRRAAEADLRRTARDLEKMHDLLDAQKLAAMLPAYGDEAQPAPTPSVVRPVRHRGQTAAALKSIAAPAVVPQFAPVDDRFVNAMARLRVVE